MSTGDYIATFASILVGLGVADLAVSLHRLIRARSRIEWDWLPLAAALLVLLSAIQFWWVSFALWSGQSTFGFAEFLPILLTLLLLFLLAASALPDELPEDHFDLRRYYDENRTYFWGLFALLGLVGTLTRFGQMLREDMSASDLLRVTPENVWKNAILMALMLILACTDRRRVHVVIVLVILISVSSEWLWETIDG